MSRERLDWQGARERLERIRLAAERPPEQAAAREGAYRARAELLARPAQPMVHSGEAETIMIVHIGPERYGLPLSRVLEVIPHPRCAPVPGAPAWVAGVIQVRGEIRPVLELSKSIGLPEADNPERSVLLLRGAGRDFGVLADGVDEIRPVAVAERLPAPRENARVQWMTQDLVPVLKPDLLFEEEA